MGNMSYCRFQNTVRDLEDCADNMEEPDQLSKEEKRARKRLIDLCALIASDYKDDPEDE